MLTLFKVILLATVCNLATAKYFNWKHFEPIEGDKETKIVWDAKLETLTLKDGRNIKYLYGTCTSTEELQGSVQTRYLIKSATKTIDETISVCNHTLHEKYLKPYGKNANFKIDSDCPLPPLKITFNKANSKDDITAPSDLPPGSYSAEIVVIDGMKSLGGFRGQFDCYEDS